MLRDVEVADAEREVDGVDVLERRGKERQVEARNAARGRQRHERTDPRKQRFGPSDAASRSTRPSFRLPVRYPCRSMVTWRYPTAFNSR